MTTAAEIGASPSAEGSFASKVPVTAITWERPARRVAGQASGTAVIKTLHHGLSE